MNDAPMILAFLFAAACTVSTPSTGLPSSSVPLGTHPPFSYTSDPSAVYVEVRHGNSTWYAEPKFYRLESTEQDCTPSFRAHLHDPETGLILFAFFPQGSMVAPIDDPLGGARLITDDHDDLWAPRGEQTLIIEGKTGLWSVQSDRWCTPDDCWDEQRTYTYDLLWETAGPLDPSRCALEGQLASRPIIPGLCGVESPRRCLGEEPEPELPDPPTY